MKTLKIDYRNWLLIFLFVWVYTGLFAQQTVQVVTKTINKELPVNAGDTLQIFAEKADLIVTGWKGKKIVLKLELISKHSRKEIAEAELAYLSYQIDLENKLFIKNYFTIDDGFKKVKGNLSARYELKVPEKLALKIKNKYGNLTVKSMKGYLELDTRFVNSTLEDCSGAQRISALFGKVELLENSGSINLNLQKADLNVNYFAGDMKVISNYGFVTFTGDVFKSLELQGIRTTISLTMSDLQLYNYELTASNSKVIVPSSPIVERKDLSVFHQSFGADKPLIKITNTYRPITLNLQYNASNK